MRIFDENDCDKAFSAVEAILAISTIFCFLLILGEFVWRSIT